MHKQTYHVYISGPRAFLDSTNESGIHLSTERMEYMEDMWVYIGEQVFEFPANLRDELESKAIQAINEQLEAERKNYLARKELLENERAQIMSLPAPASDTGVEGNGTG